MLAAPTPIDHMRTVQEDSTATIRIPVITQDIVGSDNDLDPGELVSITGLGPAQGTATHNEFVVFYTPAPNFSGTDTFSYTVTDHFNQPGPSESGTANIIITVTPVNDPPVAEDDSFSSSGSSPVTGNLLANNGNGADSDIDGDSLSIDTSPVSGPSNGSVSLNANGNFSYTPNGGFVGTDNFQYRVTDGSLTDTATVSITISAGNAAPVARDDSFVTDENTPLNGNVLSDNGNGVDSDANGDPLTVNSTPTVAPGNGQVTLSANGDFTYTPNADFVGADSFEYEVSDGSLTATATVNITVVGVNQPPVAMDDSGVGDEDSQITGNVLNDNGNGVDSDPDGDPLTVSTLASPANGTLTLNANGDYTYTPAADFNGADSFTYELSDGNGGTDSATVSLTVNPVNDGPVARNDAFAVNQNTALNGNVLGTNGNGADFDPDGDPLTVNTTPTVAPSNGQLTLNATGEFTYTPDANFSGTDNFSYEVSDGTETATANVTINVSGGNQSPVAQDDAATGDEDSDISGNVLSDNGNGPDSDPDGGTLTVALLTPPANGIVSLDPDGAYTYTPNPNFNGADSFTYELSDGQGGTNEATVSLTVNPVNDRPITRNDVLSVDENTTLNGNVLGRNGNGLDSDPDGDPLTVATAPTSGPSNGQVTISENGDFAYTPDADFVGTDVFNYSITDGLLSATGKVTITVVNTNDPPVANDDAVGTNEDTDLVGNVLNDNGNGADSDSDGGTLLVSLLTPTSNGSVALGAGGAFIYTPNANFNGLDTFTYQLGDSQGGVDNATVTITVQPVNDAPTANDDNLVGNFNTPISGSLFADTGNGVDSDIDGDTLSLAPTPVTPPQNGTVELVADGTFTYTPADGFTGADSFTYSISDGNLSSNATANITILSAENDAPVAQDDSFSIDEDSPLESENVLGDNGSGADSDPDGDPLTVTLLTGPNNGTITLNADGAVELVPELDFNGTITFTYELSDGKGGTDTATATVNVAPVNDSPVGRDDAFSVEQGNAVTGNVLDDNGNGADSDVEDAELTVDTTPTTPPSNGSVTLSEDGAFEYTPNADFTGTDSFVYTVNDSDGASATAEVTITVTDGANTSPVAQADSVTGDEDTTITGNVLDDNGNGADSDADGDPLTAMGPTDTLPQHGSVTVALDGSFSYVPDANFFGSDAFSYSIDDGNGGTSSAVVTVNVSPTNDTPVAVPDNFMTTVGQPLSGNVLADNGNGPDFDPDQGGLSINLTRTRPIGGKVALMTDGSFEYTPDPGFVGSDRFGYILSDAEGDLATALVRIEVVPGVGLTVISAETSSPNGQSQAGEPVAFSAVFNDTGPGTGLQGLIDWGDGSPEEPVEVVDDDTVNAEHEYADPGTYTVEFTISNDAGDSDSITANAVVSVPTPAVIDVVKNNGVDIHDQLDALSIQFNESVEASLDASDLTIVASDGSIVDTSSATVIWDAETDTATWDLSASDFPIDRYTAVLLSSDLEDQDGVHLDGDADGVAGGNFAVDLIVTWAGDTDLNLTVNFRDFLALSTSFAQLDTGWANGDFDADGETAFVDFLELSANFTAELLLPEPLELNDIVEAIIQARTDAASGAEGGAEPTSAEVDEAIPPGGRRSRA